MHARLDVRGLPAPVWVIGAMLSAQLGTALSVPLFSAIGPSGTAWLRVVWAAAFLLLVARPRLSGLSARSLAWVLLLGLATAAMTLCYFEAVARIPLGMATTIELLGPLGVAVVAARRLEHVLWAALAGMGVLLLAGNSVAEPADRIGIAFAAVSAVGAGLAVLVPLLTYTLEMLSLRRIAARTFGILMSAEPAIGTLVGLVVLRQWLEPVQLAGIGCVVAASLGAARGDARTAISREYAHALCQRRGRL